MLVRTTGDKMYRRLRSGILALMGFLGGLLLMYIALLGKIRRLDDTAGLYHSHTVSGSCNDTGSSGCQPPVNVTAAPLTWDARQKLRSTMIAETCTTWGMTSSSRIAESRAKLDDNHNIIVDSKHGVLFCAIPKVACSSWRVAMATLTDNFHSYDAESLGKVHLHTFMASLGLPSPSFVSDAELKKALQNYTKLLVVRHPLERLISAYRDKFRTYNKWTKHFQKKYGRQIVLLYRRENATVEALSQGNDVTFEEFLSFITDDSIPPENRINPHWDTYLNLCHPCHVHYDHVIKFETMDVDNDMVLRRYFAINNTRAFFPKRNMKVIASRELMREMYRDIPRSLLIRVYTVFRTDMEMFEYDWPEFILSGS